MTQKFYAIVTNIGAAKIANAASLGTKINITHMAVGDGGGVLPTPDASQTKLVNEVRRGALNLINVDADNGNQIIAEQVIPENEGGFWIREMGLFDADGSLIAVGNAPETYKPQLQQGSGRTQRLRMMIIVSSTEAVTVKVDPSVILATRQYVDDKVIEVNAYSDDALKKHVAAANPHSQYLQIANALSELKSSSLIDELFKNLGLGEAATRGVGTTQNQLPAMSSFGSSMTGAGWQKLPSGLIIQWGIASGSVGRLSASYPISFPNAVLQAMASLADKTSGVTAGISLYVNNETFADKSTITILPSGSDGTGITAARFIAIGY